MAARSLRTRLLASITVLLVLFFGITIVALNFVFQNLSERALRDRLEVQLIALISASDEDSSGGLQPAPQLAEARFKNPGSGLYAEILRSDGFPSWRSNSLTGTGLEFSAERKTGRKEFKQLHGSDGSTVLALSMAIDWEFANGITRSFTYSVAENLQPYNAQLHRFRGQLFSWFSVLMALLLGAFAIMLRRLLAPLRRAEREIEAVEQGAITELSEDYPRELQGVTTNLNALLRAERERLARYRNTLGNLAHSFKTPLAVMRNLLSGTTFREAVDRNVIEQLDQQVSRMDDIVKYQLKRAAASGGVSLGTAPVKVQEALQALRSALLKVYIERGIDCELVASDRCLFYGDREDLTEIAGNLVDNAFKWCRSKIRISAEPVISLTARRDG